MSKRTARADRPLQDRDFWPTPPSAVLPLLPWLDPGTRFVEPCAGDGALVRHLESFGHQMVAALDVLPRDRRIRQGDARHLTAADVAGADAIITNPPWTRPLVVPMLDRWLPLGLRVFLLVPMDWLANQWFAPYAPMVAGIAPVGRVSWLGNGKGGMENATWIAMAEWTPPNGPLKARLPRTGGQP